MGTLGMAPGGDARLWFATRIPARKSTRYGARDDRALDGGASDAAAAAAAAAAVVVVVVAAAAPVEPAIAAAAAAAAELAAW